MKLLIAKNFVIPFESGIVVIKHWRIHNYIRADRLMKTVYKEERELLDIKDNGSYTIITKNQVSDRCQSSDGQMTDRCQSSDSIGKVRLGKDRIGEDSKGEVSIEDVCTEPLASSEPETDLDAPAIILNDGSEWRPTVADINEWRKF